MFFLGEMLNLYLDESTLSENRDSLKLSKFSFPKFERFELSKEIFNSFCFRQLHITVL